jgi:Class II Aldolase and Adducin N-terminal domain
LVEPIASAARITATGGREAWSPRIMPSAGPELTTRQKLAAAFRILAAAAFSENISGHITVRRDDSDDLSVNPWGLWWEEVTASNVCLVSPARLVTGTRGRPVRQAGARAGVIADPGADPPAARLAATVAAL